MLASLCVDIISGAAPVLWQGYLPQDYEKLDTTYGSEADLRRCVAALRKRRIKALADLVLNHRCAQEKVLSAHRLFPTAHAGCGVQWGLLALNAAENQLLSLPTTCCL